MNTSNSFENLVAKTLSSQVLKCIMLCKLPFLSEPVAITSSPDQLKSQLKEMLDTPSVEVYEFILVPMWSSITGITFEKYTHEKFLNEKFTINS